MEWLEGFVKVRVGAPVHLAVEVGWAVVELGPDPEASARESLERAQRRIEVLETELRRLRQVATIGYANGLVRRLVDEIGAGEVARMCGVHKGTVARWYVNGSGPTRARASLLRRLENRIGEVVHATGRREDGEEVDLFDDDGLDAETAAWSERE